MSEASLHSNIGYDVVDIAICVEYNMKIPSMLKVYTRPLLLLLRRVRLSIHDRDGARPLSNLYSNGMSGDPEIRNITELKLSPSRADLMSMTDELL